MRNNRLNFSRGKVYLIIFAIVAIVYITYVGIKMMNTPSKAEHFQVDDNYQYRMEVMKVFDLYLNRNPSTEEIEKYSGLKNEQDILTRILVDFNISSVDVDSKKLEKKEDTTLVKKKQESFEDVVPQKDEKEKEHEVGDKSSSDVKEPVDVAKTTEKEDTTTSATTDKVSEPFAEKPSGKKKMVCITKDSYNELKTLLFSLQAQLQEMDM